MNRKMLRALMLMLFVAPNSLHARGEVIEIDRKEIDDLLRGSGCPRDSAKQYTSITAGMIYIECLTRVLERLGCMEPPEGGSPSFGHGLECLREANGRPKGNGGGGQRIDDVRLMLGAYASDGDGSVPLMGISLEGPDVRTLAADAILDPFVTSEAPLAGAESVRDRYGLELMARDGGGFTIGRMSVGGPAFLQGKGFGTGDALEQVIFDTPGQDAEACGDMNCIHEVASRNEFGEAIRIGADLILQAEAPDSRPWIEVRTDKRQDLLRKYMNQILWAKLGLVIVDGDGGGYAKVHKVRGQSPADQVGLTEGQKILSQHEPKNWGRRNDQRPLQGADYIIDGVYDGLNEPNFIGIIGFYSGAIGEKPQHRKITVSPGAVVFDGGVVALDADREFSAVNPGRDRREAERNWKLASERKAQEIEAARPREFVMFEETERSILELVYRGEYAAAANYVPQRAEYTPSVDSIFMDPVRRMIHSGYSSMRWKPLVKDYAIWRASVLGACPGDSRALTVVTTTTEDGRIVGEESRQYFFNPDFYRIIVELDNFDTGTGMNAFRLPWAEFFGQLSCNSEFLSTMDRNMVEFYDY